MVRLKVLQQAQIHHLSLFQFHYGTIKSLKRRTDAINYFKFQFHYGTIKSLKSLTAIIRQNYFNSTMVRLKDDIHKYHRVVELFQFHYGTIKRSDNIRKQVTWSLNFNSTMVRLKAKKKMVF